VPLNKEQYDYWFLGVGFGSGFSNKKFNDAMSYVITSHKYFKLFIGFDFGNISISLSYNQDTLSGKANNTEPITPRFKAFNLCIGTKFTI
jgi:hypothetical protein